MTIIFGIYCCCGFWIMGRVVTHSHSQTFLITRGLEFIIVVIKDFSGYFSLPSFHFDARSCAALRSVSSFLWWKDRINEESVVLMVMMNWNLQLLFVLYNFLFVFVFSEQWKMPCEFLLWIGSALSIKTRARSFLIALVIFYKKIKSNTLLIKILWINNLFSYQENDFESLFKD